MKHIFTRVLYTLHSKLIPFYTRSTVLCVCAVFFIGCVHLWVALNETAIMDALAAAIYNLPVLEAERMNSGLVG